MRIHHHRSKMGEWCLIHSSLPLHKCDHRLRECNASPSKPKVVSHRQVCLTHSSLPLLECQRPRLECNAFPSNNNISFHHNRCLRLLQECNALHSNNRAVLNNLQVCRGNDRPSNNNNRQVSLPLNRYRLPLQKCSVLPSNLKVNNLQIWTNCACLLINRDNRNVVTESSLQTC